MKKLFIACIAAAVLCGAPARAADMPVKAPPMAPVAAPAYSWTGFYIGVEGGGGWADTQHTNNITGGNSGTAHINGGLLGGTYGYNLQFGSWVLGLEGDFSWSGIKSSFSDNGSGFCPAAAQCLTNLRWLGTDRARLGYAWDRFLVYGTAGVAYGDVHGTLNFPGFTAGDTTRVGFIYGGGAEWAFARAWSVKAEYLRTDLGDKATYGVPAFPLVENVSLKNVNIVRVGLNYRFGGL
jgi:outer membrane immunogenic protein